MNKGVEILLERMKSNPEEFVSDLSRGSSRWWNVTEPYQQYLSEEDKKTLDDAWRETVRKVMEERFTEAVMKELLDPKSEEGVTLTSINHPRGMHSGGQTLGQLSNAGLTLTANNNGGVQWANTATQSATLTLGQTAITEHELAHLKAHTEYMRIQMEAEKAKLKQKHQTLFGKLYNYLGTNK